MHHDGGLLYGDRSYRMTLAKFGVKAFSIFVLLASVATTAEARKVQMAVATF